MCAPLWKNRITCKKLFMQKTTCTVEQCEALLNILKPVAIFLNSEESNRFEALFQSKTLVTCILHFWFNQVPLEKC